MNCLSFILICILNIRSAEDPCKVQRAFFLENDFWCIDQEQIKTDNGYLFKVNIDVKHKSGFITGFDILSETCFSLKSTNLRYVVLRYWLFEEAITSFLMYPKFDDFLLIFRFLFTDEPIICNCPHCLEEHRKKIQRYCITYKLPEKISENSLGLRSDGIDVRMKHINERFEVFPSPDLIRFNEFMKVLDVNKEEKRKIEKDANFDLYYFENYSECFKNLKKFVKGLCYFKLLKDDEFESLSTSETSFNITTTLKVSQFKKRFFERIYENLKGTSFNEINENWIPLIDRCNDYFVNVMLNNNFFLLIEGKYDIDYYIGQFCNFIYESVEHIRKTYGIDIPENEDFIFSRMSSLLKLDFEKLQLSAMEDLLKFEYIPKHFSKLLEVEVKTLNDYIKVEKIICDYHNMFNYIVNLYQKFNKILYVPLTYFPPIFIDKYNLKIFDGLKIDFNWPNKFEDIRGFDNKEKEIFMIRNTDYFIDLLGVLYCPSSVLKMKNIQEIEVFSFNEEKNKKNSTKIKVNNYISI